MASLRTLLGLALCATLAACSANSDSDSASTTAHLNDDGFTDLSKAQLDYPENLNRPLTADDIKIVAGYDGKTPEEVATTIRANFQGTMDRSWESFIHDQSIMVHKRWTLVIANCFAKNFPAATFVQTVSGEGTHVFIIATPRGEIFLKTTNPDDGDQWYLAKGNSFEPMAVAAGFKPFTPPIAQAELRVTEQQIHIDYPTWEWPQLAKHGEVIEEQ
jgi:hypothetical protein